MFAAIGKAKKTVLAHSQVRHIEVQALNFPGLAMQTSSNHGSHFLTTRRFEFGEVILEENRVYDGAASAKGSFLPRKFRAPPKLVSTLREIRSETLRRTPHAAADFDRLTRFILKSSKMNLEEIFNVSNLVGSLRLTRVQENLIRTVWNEFPTTLLKSIQFEDLAFFLQQATAMRQILGPQCEALFRDITFCKHHCYPNVSVIHDGKTARVVCINRSGIRENKPLNFAFVRPFQSRNDRQSQIKAFLGKECLCSQCYSPDLSRSFKCSNCPGTMHPSYDYDEFECTSCARRLQTFNQKAGIGQEHFFEKKISSDKIYDFKRINLLTFFEQRQLHPVHYLGYNAITKQADYILQHNLEEHFDYCKDILSIGFEALQDWPSLFYNHEGLELCRKLLLFDLSNEESERVITAANHIVELTCIQTPDWLDSVAISK